MLISGNTEIRIDGTPITRQGKMKADSCRMEIPPMLPGMPSNFVTGRSISEPEITLTPGVGMIWPEVTLKFRDYREFYRFADWVQETRFRYEDMAKRIEYGILTGKIAEKEE